MKPPRAFGPVTSPRTLLLAFVGAAAIYAGPLSGEEAPSRQGLRAAIATLQDARWTAVTMAPDGSWGVATDITGGGALAKAIANCRIMSKGEMGCGAQARMIRTSWIVGLRCGDRNTVASERLLADAERAARNREAELRQFYAPDMPPCRRILVAGTRGAVATATIASPD